MILSPGLKRYATRNQSVFTLHFYQGAQTLWVHSGRQGDGGSGAPLFGETLHSEHAENGIGYFPEDQARTLDQGAQDTLKSVFLLMHRKSTFRFTLIDGDLYLVPYRKDRDHVSPMWPIYLQSWT